MEPLSVVLFSEDYLPNIGGVASHVHELARALDHLGHLVTVVAMAPGRVLRLRDWNCRVSDEDGVRVLRLPTFRLPRGYGLYYRWRHAIRRLCGDPQGRRRMVYHVHAGFNAFVPKDAPRLFTNHTSMFLQSFSNAGLLALWRDELATFDHVIAPSQELSERTIDAGVSPTRVHYIPNGVDVDRFRPDPALRAATRRRLGLQPDDVVILCARRLVPKNGVLDFAHALRFLDVSQSRVHVIVAGNSNGQPQDYELEVLGALQGSNVMTHVHLLGEVPNSQMAPIYAASDIAVLPSLKEATSITGLEAMASGLAVVATRVGGLPDMIDDGENGALADPGDPRSLAAALNRVIANATLRTSYALAARAKVCEKMTWAHVARQTTAVYELACGTATLPEAPCTSAAVTARDRRCSGLPGT